MFWKFLKQFLCGFIKITACILLIVPLASTHVFQKPVDLFFRFKNFAIEVLGIPIDENRSQIKNDSIYFIIHNSQMTSKLRLKKTILALSFYVFTSHCTR